ncbi:MAG: hypothetical protein ACYC9J_06735 [Sulfuricaulis sp.]
MLTKIADRNYRIEVLPYSEAPWAPSAQGTALRWAWRIVDDMGRSLMVGSSSKSEQEEVRRLAESALIRMIKLDTGKPTKINPTLNRRSRTRAPHDTPQEQELAPEAT